MKRIQSLFEAQVVLGRSADEQRKGAIEAMVTSWGPREGMDGRRFYYTPAPFEAWHETFKQRGRPLPMYYQHNDTSLPVGEWTEFHFTDEGMLGKGNLYMSTTAGADLYSIMKESPRMIGGVSVGAYADEFQMVDEDGENVGDSDDDMDGYFQILKGGLQEVSIVMQPNNVQAQISKLELIKPEIYCRVFEKSLRDAGYSRRSAQAATALLKSMVEQFDAQKPKTEKPTDVRDSEGQALLELLTAREVAKHLSTRLKDSQNVGSSHQQARRN
jgi:HK97 family phage prohead protease